MKIRDITLQENKEGKNWKVFPSRSENVPIEEWDIESSDSFNSDDNVAYSALFVTEDGQVTPLLQIKEVGGLDYGGDYAEYKNGKWQQLRLEPNPSASKGKDYVANPLDNDPSFDAEDDYRKKHKENFKTWVKKLG